MNVGRNRTWARGNALWEQASIGSAEGRWQGREEGSAGCEGEAGQGGSLRRGLHCRERSGEGQSVRHRVVAGMLPADAWMIRSGCHAAPLVEEEQQQQERYQHCLDRVASVGREQRGEAGAGARVEAVWEILGSRGDVGVRHRADWGSST